MRDLEELLASQPTLEGFDRLARQGVPRQLVDELANALGVRIVKLAPLVHTSSRTLRRYRSDQLLSPDVSERVLQIVRVFSQSTEVLEDREKAARWLTGKNRALNAVPLELMGTVFGVERVLQILGRIEHTVYS